MRYEYMPIDTPWNPAQPENVWQPGLHAYLLDASSEIPAMQTRPAVIICPGARLETSTSTGAPAALARSDGSMLETKGTSAAAAPTPPTAAVAMIKRRLPQSILLSSLIVPIPDGWFDYSQTGPDYTQDWPWEKAQKDAKYLIRKRFPLTHSLCQGA